MRLLALDTATEACSAALLNEGEITSRSEIVPRRHAELILAMIDELLAEADLRLNRLDAIAFGRGPGAFTGVRIAAGVTQGLAWGSNLPVIPVSSLAALAQSAAGQADTVLAAVDARMGEVYWCCYQVKEGRVTAITDEQVSKPDHVYSAVSGPLYGVGTGWDTYGDLFSKKFRQDLQGYDGSRYPLAECILPLAVELYDENACLDFGSAVPVYIRNRVTG